VLAILDWMPLLARPAVRPKYPLHTTEQVSSGTPIFFKEEGVLIRLLIHPDLDFILDHADLEAIDFDLRIVEPRSIA